MQSQLVKVLDSLLELRPPLGEPEQRLSLALYRLLAEGEPVPVSRLAHAASLDPARVQSVLSEWPGVYRDAEERVIGYWGLTIVRMAHRLRVNDRWLYAWCAWDTLFLPALLGSAARVESSCPVTGAGISLEVGHRGPRSEGAPPFVSFVAPDPRKAAADIVSSFCHYVHFLAGEAAAREWTAARPGTVVATLDEAWQLGRRRNERCYPGRTFEFAGEATRAS